MGVPSGYTSGQVVQAVPTGINSALVCVVAETAFSAVGTINVNNCYTIGTFTNAYGIFGPNKVKGTQTDCFASNGVSWSDETAQTYLLGTPTNVSSAPL